MKIESLKTYDLTCRLFTLWIEQEYFDRKMKTLLNNNTAMLIKFISDISEGGYVSPFLLEQFLGKTKKVTAL